MGNKEFDFHEIKTFEDACKHLGLNSGSLTYPAGGDRDSFLQAWYFYNLLIIQKAINNGVWHNEKDCCYFPYWILYSKKGIKRMSENEKQIRGLKKLTLCTNAGQIYSGVSCAVAYSNSTVTAYGFPLCFNSEEAARYAAKQFEDLFLQYYGIKVKE